MDTIVDAHARMARDNRRLVILRGPPNVDCMFRLTGAAGELEIHDLDPVEPPVQVLLELAAREPAAA